MRPELTSLLIDYILISILIEFHKSYLAQITAHFFLIKTEFASFSPQRRQLLSMWPSFMADLSSQYAV